MTTCTPWFAKEYRAGGYERKRVEAEPYPSALEHIDELYEKTWKDARYGIVLLCSSATEEVTKDLVECPQGRVPKQLPDRSISKHHLCIHERPG